VGLHWLLIRRAISTGEYAFFRAHAHTPHPVTVAELVRVAGTRWKIEEGFAGSKELAALDQHQVRGWTSWHRWTLLAMLAHAFLAVTAAAERATPAPTGSIPLTRNKIRHLLATLGHQARLRRRAPAALVTTSTPTPSPRPQLPLPPPSSHNP
jgi:hypothetical protein